MVTSQPKVCKERIRKMSAHATIDNNDGYKETATGWGTTYDTSRTLFQPLLPGKLFPHNFGILFDKLQISIAFVMFFQILAKLTLIFVSACRRNSAEV